MKKPGSPKNWRIIYEEIEKFREKNIAPVDTMGCAAISDVGKGQKIFRYQVLTSLQLSSQTKDPITAEAISSLRKKGLEPSIINNMDPKELDQIIQKVGFHNRKTFYLKKTANILLEKYEGDIPSTLEGLMELPGVGPKMAYLCLQEAWGKVEGVGVDTHVHRICNRLGWVKTRDADKTRLELQEWLPYEYWGPVNKLLVGFGQIMCKPVNPQCQACPINDICPKIIK
jgi:endonuclease-3